MDHISVCVCTFKRPELLARTLAGLGNLETGQLFSYSVVVVDNDVLESARPTVEAFAAKTPVTLRYVVEPKPNISLARNRAVCSADGNMVAFIDDDEIPTPGWLANLHRTLVEQAVDGVLGPVKPHFDSEPPKWVTSSGIYERRPHHTGEILKWSDGRTANALLRREVFNAEGSGFKPEFLTGEDVDFFRRAISRGCRFVWCAEGVVHEIEPPERWRRLYLVRKALHRGATTRLHPTFSAVEVVKSLVAVPAYALSLPIMALRGGGAFTVVLVKLCDHLGKLLAVAGVMGGGYVRE